MTISLRHAFTSAKADGTDSTLVQPSNWNAEHTLSMATARVLGRTTAGPGAVEELTADNLWTFLGYVSGTRLVFHQTTPPTGWTKDLTHNNKALRLVSGSVTTGGSLAFTTAFGERTILQTNIPNYTLPDTLKLPNHGHSDSFSISGSQSGGIARNVGVNNSKRTNNQGSVAVNTTFTDTTLGIAGAVGGITSSPSISGSVTSGGSGTPMDFGVQYVDVIVASKD